MRNDAVEHEVRIAAVMYGGASLAIYMNGVAHELLAFVRATSDADPAADAALSGTPRAYRKLARALERGPQRALAADAAPAPGKLTLRFVVDILSGTSAGGINAAMLAKALVRNADLAPLKRLWVDDGALETLINDGGSAATRATYHRPVRSLFDSDFMYDELLVAMRELNASEGEPLVDELSLAITGTDLAGRPVDLRLEDRIAREYAHRHVFRFDYLDRVTDEFTAAHDPLLAFAARTTSSLPAAFEPTVADHARSLAGAAGPGADWGLLFRDVPQAARGEYERRHAFADGGYLDNKPFGHAIDRLSRAEGGVRVTRKLFYLEPLPKRIDPDAADLYVPDALENALDVVTLARYETIRADLRRIAERNRVVRRLRTLHAGVVEDGLCRQPADGAPGEEGAGSARPGSSPARDEPARLRDLVAAYGSAYGGYHRLRVASVTHDLANAVADRLGVPEHSDLRAALHLVARSWRRARFARDHERPARRETAFLEAYDLRFHRRRSLFMLDKIDQLLELEPQVVAELENVVAGGGYPHLAAVLHADGGDEAGAPRGAWAGVLPMLREAKRIAQAALNALVRDESADPLTAALAASHPAGEGERADRLAGALLPLLAPTGDAERAALADAFAQEHRARLEAVSRALAARCRVRVARAAAALRALAALDTASGLQDDVKALLRCYWRDFVRFDQVQFPVLYDTGFGEELAPVGVHRISATDPGFYGTTFADPARLLGGRYASFGAFLDRRWRQHDIRWGRLDGAERLIASLLGDERAEERDALIAEAHMAILREELPASRDVAEALAPFSPDPSRPGGFDVARARAALEGVLQAHERGLELDGRAVARDLSRLLGVAARLAHDLAAASHLRGLARLAALGASWCAAGALALAATVLRWLSLGSRPQDDAGA